MAAPFVLAGLGGRNDADKGIGPVSAIHQKILWFVFTLSIHFLEAWPKLFTGVRAMTYVGMLSTDLAAYDAIDSEASCANQMGVRGIFIHRETA